MRKRLTHNLGLKLISILLSVILWLVVVNISDPVETKTFSNIQVTIKNQTAITDKGKVYEIKDSSDKVSVTVKAPRSVIDKLSAADLQASADLEEITDWDTVDIDVSSSRYADEILEITPRTKTMKVSIEDSATKQLAINVVASGTPGDGYALGDSTCTPNIVRVSGPASVVNQISKVVASVNIDGMTSMIKTNSSLKYYDSDGKQIESSSLDYSVDEVFTTVTMLKTKQVPLKFVVKGEPADGYKYTSVGSVPETVTIAGTAATLDKIESIKLTQEPIDITDATANVQKVIDISKYLPDGTKLADSSEASILVTAVIEPLITKDFTIPYNELSVKNLDSDYSIVYDTTDSNLLVSVKGLEKNVNNASLDTLNVYLDVDGLALGTHTSNLSVTLPDGVTLQSSKQIKYKIVKKDSLVTESSKSGSNN